MKKSSFHKILFAGSYYINFLSTFSKNIATLMMRTLNKTQFIALSFEKVMSRRTFDELWKNNSFNINPNLKIN